MILPFSNIVINAVYGNSYGLTDCNVKLIVKQQQEYCLIIRTICVITRKGPRTKLLMEISLVFSNIVINCSKGKYFLLCFILLWINFYNLHYITKVTSLPEPKRSHQSHQKQFVQKITPLLYRATRSNFTYKILFVYSQ